MERWRDDEGRFDPLYAVRDILIALGFFVVICIGAGLHCIRMEPILEENEGFPMEAADFPAHSRSIQPGMTEAEADALIQGYTSKKVGEDSTRYIMARGEDLENPDYHDRHFIIVRYDENRKVMSAQYAD